jgi:DNA-binding transcriptional LysR family regulator
MHGKRLMPTSFAENLLPELKKVTRQIDDLVSMSTEFEPAQSERLFRFMASDYMVTVLMTRVLEVLADQAPGVRLDMRLPEDSVYQVFDRGEIDLMLIPEEFILPGHPATLLFEEPYVVVAWKDSPVFNKKLSTARFFDAAHVAVTLGPKRDPSFTERNLDKLGTSASTSVRSARLHGSTCVRSPSSPASASSISRRVPDSATVAPWPCKARAIAPPMPPVAPVTSALLPLRSNIDAVL